MEAVMEDISHSRMHSYLFIILLVVAKSLQFTDDGKGVKSCNCYEQCQKNLTTNSVNDEQTKAACQRGCRFYSLVFHASYDLSPTVDYAHAKEGCLISCSESYINPDEVAGCNFGCSSVKRTDSCDSMDHQLPQITYSLIIEESDLLIHPGEPDPDDVLIDPGLRKQFEKTLETLLDSKPKLPEIHFRNLPITTKDLPADHPRTTFKCPKFYGFDPKIEFRNGKITTSDLFFLLSVLVFAMICIIISRNLEKQRKLWKQLFMGAIPNKPTLLKIKENLMKDEALLKDDYHVKDETKEVTNQIVGPTGSSQTENIDTKFEGITLVFYDEDADAHRDTKSSRSNIPDFLDV